MNPCYSLPRLCCGSQLAAFFLLIWCGNCNGADSFADQPLGQPVSFAEHIRPLFIEHCLACHGGVKQAAGLSFIYRDSATSPAESGETPIVAGKPEASHLMERVTSNDPDFRMPPPEHGGKLSENEIGLLKQWIAEGAAWEDHWSFVPPVAHPLPTVQRSEWPKQPLDYFVLAKLEASGLAPSKEASRAEWLRRASLDLTGLPPSPQAYQQFANDDGPLAYEAAVDRMLASRNFGERWASAWLDLARYADTQGFESDRGRDAWPYRDWVIRAFNDDMPFDQFTIKQLAGDLLPNASLSDRVATGFHRNTQTNSEGGTDDEEYRTAAVLDRAATTWQVWQGLTFKCAQCHSHPYDPITQDEYYQFIAFHNTTRDEDLEQDQPLLTVPLSPADWPQAEALDKKLKEMRSLHFDLVANKNASDSQWKPLLPVEAKSEGATQLAIQQNPESGAAEVLTSGTVSSNETFSVRLSAAKEAYNLHALRIEALPVNPTEAEKIPEAGFVLSQLICEVVDTQGTAISTVEFSSVDCNDKQPLLDPYDSLNDNPDGWGAYTRMFYGHSAVFVAKSPARIPAGGCLKLTMKFLRSGSGDSPLVIRRGRFYASNNPHWQLPSFVVESAHLREEISRLSIALQALLGPQTPVMVEQPDEVKRKTFMFTRGNWLVRERQAEPGTPAVFPRMVTDGAPPRQAMARWMASRENPLTARVTVNRLWQELFGVGLVETADDFGASGAKPSHPELLDHLALRFQNEHAWSVKSMLKELALSAVYRQTGATEEGVLSKDPRNRLLARGPRTRLSAEMVRDQALLLSGKLASKMYGPPVMPPQPDGVWRSVYSSAHWTTAEGEDRYRRAVYTYCKRTSGYPAMLTFDMPSRDVCVARRQLTNTPLQALVTLNDAAFVELAAAFAERMQKLGRTPAERISAGYELAMGRALADAKRDRLLLLYQQALYAFDADPAAAGHLQGDRELYALSIAASVMFNLDEFMTK